MYKPKEKEGRTVVITTHNSKSFQIDGLTFKSTPESYMFNWELRDPKTKTVEKMKTNMLEYFRIKYKITIKEK